MVRRVLIVIVAALLLTVPPPVLAESTSSTATLTVTVLPSPLDAAMISDCQFNVVSGSNVATCTAVLLVADPTLELTGWRVALASTGLICFCDPLNVISPAHLTIQSLAGPTFVNGQPINQAHGPFVGASSLGNRLDTPQLVSEAEAGYGNGAYSFTMTFRLAVPAGVATGAYIPSWEISLERQPSAAAAGHLEHGLRLAE